MAASSSTSPIYPHSTSLLGSPELCTWDCSHRSPLLTVADPFPGTEVPSSHEGGLGNRILEADPSLFQGTKIHQSSTVAPLDVDSSAQDTGETKNHQQPAATEEPKTHSGNEELQIFCPISWGRFAALCGVWMSLTVPAGLFLGLMDNDLAPPCPGEREVSSELFCVPTQQRCLPPLDSPGQTPLTAATGRNTLTRTWWG